MSNLWYILNKSEHQLRLHQQLQQQLRQQLELPPPGMSSDRFQYPTNTPTASPTAGAVPPQSRDIIPFGQYPHSTDVAFDPNAPPPSTAPIPPEGHNNIEWKYHTHRPEADGDSLGRKAGKRKLVIPRDLLKMKQMNAALKIGIPPSTFSKRWRESLPDRTWPYRNHRRIEKNIKMLKAMQHKGHDVTEELGRMQQQQEENLSPAVIDVYEDVNEEYLMKVDEKKWPTSGSANRQAAPPGVHHHPYPPPNTPQQQPQQLPAIPSTSQPSQLQIPQQQLAHIQSQLAHSPSGQPKLISVHPLVPPQQHQLQSPPHQIPSTTSSLQSPSPQIQATPLQTSPPLQPPPQVTSSLQPQQTIPIPVPVSVPIPSQPQQQQQQQQIPQDVKPILPPSSSTSSSSTSSSTSSEPHPTATEAPSQPSTTSSLPIPSSQPQPSQHITEQPQSSQPSSVPSSNSPPSQLSPPAPVQATSSLSSQPTVPLEQPNTSSPPSSQPSAANHSSSSSSSSSSSAPAQPEPTTQQSQTFPLSTTPPP